MISQKFVLPSLASLLLFNAALLADETEEGTLIEEHVSVRSRETDPDKKEFMRDLRAKEIEEEDMQSDKAQAGRMFRRASAKVGESGFRLAPREAMTRPSLP